MGVLIKDALSFLRNLWFRRVILPDPATLILYWQLGSISVIHSAMSHRWLFGFWMETVLSLWSGDKACAVWLYILMRSVLHLDNVFFPQFWAVAIHSGCGLYKCGCDGLKSQRCLWSKSCTGDNPMPWIGGGVFIAGLLVLPCHYPRNPGVLCSPLWVFLQS